MQKELLRGLVGVRFHEGTSETLVLEERGRVARFTAGPRELVTLLVT